MNGTVNKFSLTDSLVGAYLADNYEGDYLF